MRLQEIRNVFLEKASTTASSQRPRRCHGALVASYRVPTEFLLAIVCALTTRSLRFHGAHIACTVLSRRLHCAFTAFALRLWHGISKSMQISGTVAIRILIQPSKPKTGNNYMCNIKNSLNTREHIVNRVSSYF